MKALTLTLALLVAAPALADTPVSAPDYAAFVTGQTITYRRPGDGSVVGVERHFATGRVVWLSYARGQCLPGAWAAREDGAICYSYDAEDRDWCWDMRRRPDGTLIAVNADEPPSGTIYEVTIEGGEVICPEFGS